MLSSPHNHDPNFIEAIVLTVDPIRFICSVKTINGKPLKEVRWLLPTGGSTEFGSHFTPLVGDRVLISTSLTYPLILGTIPSIGADNNDQISMTGSPATPDPGTDSTMGGGIAANSFKPVDFVPGDFVYRAKGGSMLAVLTGGITLLKASTLSQIVMSKFEGLVRIVTRNYQRFSDSSSRVSTNMKGRLYEWFGVDWLITNNRNGTERYQELYGDVAAGELLRGTPSNVTTLPAVDSRVKKEWLLDSNGNAVMVETLKQDGSITLTVQNAAGTNVSTSYAGSSGLTSSSSSVSAGTIGNILAGSLYLFVSSASGFAQGNTIIIMGAGAGGANLSTTIDHISGNIFTIHNAASTTTTGGGVVVLGTTVVKNTYAVKLTPTSTTIDFNAITTVWGSISPTPTTTTTSSLVFSSTNILVNYSNLSKLTLDASQAKLESNGHAVTITDTGVALS